jgi:predicted NAD/FAD-dependent oxidoreductase
MSARTVVVGAGVSGLLVARELAARGQEVVVLEKSRGVGGRLATKRVGAAVFDQGAQYFTVRDGVFAAWVEAWRARGAAGPWPEAPEGRFIGRPGMTGIAKALAEGLDVRREQKVTAVARESDGRWRIDTEGGQPLRAGRLVLSAPLPQSLALLAAGGVDLPDGLGVVLATIDYHPCLALLVELAEPSRVPAEGMAFADGPLRWMADNVRKGVSPDVAAAVTLHATPAFSREHYALDAAAVAERLLPAAEPWLGGARVLSTTLHRWRYSEPTATWPENCLWWPERGLGVCGDAFGGPRVEGAATSGLALARRILEEM